MPRTTNSPSAGVLGRASTAAPDKSAHAVAASASVRPPAASAAGTSAAGAALKHDAEPGGRYQPAPRDGHSPLWPGDCVYDGVGVARYESVAVADGDAVLDAVTELVAVGVRVMDG